MNCSKCSCKLSERDKIIKCVNCVNSYHVACSSLANVNDEIFIKKSESWACYVCEAVKLVREIKKSVSKHDSLLSELNKKLDEVSNQLRDLETRIIALENRMDQFDSRLSNVESLRSKSDESLISEMLDRQSRARNLIIFNLPESNNSHSPEEDKLLVKSVLDTLSPNLGTATVFRLGHKSDEPRPVKVTLLEVSDDFTVLKNKHKLRTSDFNSFRITPDRTAMQRYQLREVLSKLEQRKAAGESNLVMKFVKDIPTISKN
ncbi:hypothetical protein QTP88_028724 [Uroleucon formosanum]